MENNSHSNLYNQRYLDGYMEEWDAAKKIKVKEIINQLPLPKTGYLLDFGCGNGVFTKVLKDLLPQWEVYGVEISQVAVQNASEKIKDCNFFQSNESEKYFGQFDFVFSHHVLEHVENISETISTINSFLKPNSSQLHILPCGNKDSFEHQICMLHKNGIEHDKENRFFFEEPGHLRRLNTEDMKVLWQDYNFQLQKDFYSNQYYGAINWITKSSPKFVKKLTNFLNGIDEKSAIEIKKLNKKLLPLTYLQFPYSKYWQIKNIWNKSLIDYLKLIILFFPALISKLVCVKYDTLAMKEWNEKKSDIAGSEMFLFFNRK